MSTFTDMKHLLGRLRELSMLQYPSSLEEVSSRSKQLDCLQIALRTQPHSFVSSFLEVCQPLGPLYNVV